MIKGGVPLLDAVRLAKRSTSNLYVQGLLDSIEDDLIEGFSASKAMSEANFLPPEAAQMLSTAERTGRFVGGPQRYWRLLRRGWSGAA